jgi:hypothetical protein
VDPLWEKNLYVGSYVFCHNNPINRIDPDGKIDYVVSKNGYFRQKSQVLDDLKSFLGLNDKNDRIILEGSKTVISNLPLGSIGKIDDNSSRKTQFEIKDKRIAEKVFKDLSYNTNVEWGRVSYSSKKASGNILVNQHDDQDVSVAAGVALDCIKEGKNVPLLEHSHLIPMDYKDMPSFNINLSPSNEDRSTARLLPNTTQRVLNTFTNQYEYYNKNGVYKKESIEK